MNNKIAAALVKSQKEFGPALKTSTNPHFKSRYADLSACVEAVIDALNCNGIAMLQQTQHDDIGVSVQTVFLHDSGESWESGWLHVPAAKQDPQGYGSALTYARRYSLMAACGIAPEDDDGNAASKPQPKAQSKQSKEPPPLDIDIALDYIRAAESLEDMKDRGRQVWGQTQDKEHHAKIKALVDELAAASAAAA